MGGDSAPPGEAVAPLSHRLQRVLRRRHFNGDDDALALDLPQSREEFGEFIFCCFSWAMDLGLSASWWSLWRLLQGYCQRLLSWLTTVLEGGDVGYAETVQVAIEGGSSAFLRQGQSRATDLGSKNHDDNPDQSVTETWAPAWDLHGFGCFFSFSWVVSTNFQHMLLMVIFNHFTWCTINDLMSLLKFLSIIFHKIVVLGVQLLFCTSN